MRTKHKTGLFFFGALLASVVGCSESGGGEPGLAPGGSANITQGGAKDFAEFRSVVEAGQVPSSDVLDPVGFFAEHALDMPPADCGQDICVHPFLAVAPRFNGGNWTMGYVTMNTAVDPNSLPHPPVHLAIAVEDGLLGLYADAVQANLQSLLADMGPEDRVSVVAFDSHADRLVDSASPDDDLIPQVVLSSLKDAGDGGTGLYEAIATADEALSEGDENGFSGEHRILLLTSGHAKDGITDPDHIVSLAENIVRKGTAFSVIGAGEEYDSTIPSEIGSLGAGTYAYAQSAADMALVLLDEAQTSLYPLATDLTVDIAPSKGYSVGRVYGVHRAEKDGDKVTLSLPAVFIGTHEGASDVGGGRRGGGGALFVELIADSSAGVAPNSMAFDVTAGWTPAGGGPKANLNTPINNSMSPGQNPDGMWWTLSEGDGKPFMMLNLYLAFRGVVDFYEAGDCARALGVVDMMQLSVGGWLGKYSDDDISQDNNLLLQLRQNVDQACAAHATPVSPVMPTSFEGGCCML